MAAQPLATMSEPLTTRWVRRCVTHHLVLIVAEWTRWYNDSHDSDMRCPAGHDVTDHWEVYDRATGRTLLCSAELPEDSGKSEHWHHIGQARCRWCPKQ